MLKYIAVIETQDQSHRNSSSKTWNMNIARTWELTNSASLKCLLMISPFNFYSLIVCQMHFPNQSLLFYPLYAQNLLELSAAMLLEFVIFTSSYGICCVVPVALFNDTNCSVSDETYLDQYGCRGCVPFVVSWLSNRAARFPSVKYH